MYYVYFLHALSDWQSLGLKLGNYWAHPRRVGALYLPRSASYRMLLLRCSTMRYQKNSIHIHHHHHRHPPLIIKIIILVQAI
jgi:hypothetical protein